MKTKIFAILAAGVAIAAIPTAATAQGIPTYDASNIIQSGKIAVNSFKQLEAQAKQLTSSNLLNKAVGMGENRLNSILGGVGLNFGASGGDDTFVQLKSSVPGLVDSLYKSEVGKSLGITEAMSQDARTSIMGGRKLALTSFYKSGNATMDEVSVRRGVRQAAMRDSLTAGYAMAVFAKNDINKSETMMKALSEQLSQSKDLRTDVQGNSAVALAQLRQMTIQNQLIAQMLEVQSTAAMADDNAGTQ